MYIYIQYIYIHICNVFVHTINGGGVPHCQKSYWGNHRSISGAPGDPADQFSSTGQCIGKSETGGPNVLLPRMKKN